MPVYHLALFKLKQDADPAKVKQGQTLAESMVGDVSGLVELHAAPPLKYTVERAKGYDMGVVVLLDGLLSFRRFAKHPSHTRLNELYKDVCDAEHTVAYDIQFRNMASEAQKSGWKRWVLCFVILALFMDFFVARSFPFSGSLSREVNGEVSGVRGEVAIYLASIGQWYTLFVRLSDLSCVSAPYSHVSNEALFMAVLLPLVSTQLCIPASTVSLLYTLDRAKDGCSVSTRILVRLKG